MFLLRAHYMSDQPRRSNAPVFIGLLLGLFLGTLMGCIVGVASTSQGGYGMDFSSVYAGLCFGPLFGASAGAGIGWCIKESP